MGTTTWLNPIFMPRRWVSLTNKLTNWVDMAMCCRKSPWLPLTRFTWRTTTVWPLRTSTKPYSQTITPHCWWTPIKVRELWSWSRWWWGCTSSLSWLWKGWSPSQCPSTRKLTWRIWWRCSARTSNCRNRGSKSSVTNRLSFNRMRRGRLASL